MPLPLTLGATALMPYTEMLHYTTVKETSDVVSRLQNRITKLQIRREYLKANSELMQRCLAREKEEFYRLCAEEFGSAPDAKAGVRKERLRRYCRRLSHSRVNLSSAVNSDDCTIASAEKYVRQHQVHYGLSIEGCCHELPSISKCEAKVLPFSLAQCEATVQHIDGLEKLLDDNEQELSASLSSRVLRFGAFPHWPSRFMAYDDFREQLENPEHELLWLLDVNAPLGISDSFKASLAHPDRRQSNRQVLQELLDRTEEERRSKLQPKGTDRPIEAAPQSGRLKTMH